MVTVASGEPKNRRRKYRALVRAGETPLVASGALTLGTGRLNRRVKPTVMTRGKTVAEMVAEDRR